MKIIIWPIRERLLIEFRTLCKDIIADSIKIPG